MNKNILTVSCFLLITYQLFLITSAANSTTTNATVSFSKSEFKILVGHSAVFYVKLNNTINEPFDVQLQYDMKIANLSRVSFQFTPDNETSRPVTIFGLDAGHTEVQANASLPYVSTLGAYLDVRVFHSRSIDVLSDVVGWVYFVCWTISFYPQMYENYVRKSVVGLNFDFLALNFMGHMSYNIFNIGLFWIPSVQAEYKARFPHGVIPVQPNDVGFSMHAVVATFCTIIQAVVYERGDQRVSYTCMALMAAMLLFLLISLILASVSVILWLDFLYFISYVKLAITLMKYCPQAYHNFKRRSTEGWSIGNVILDFSGGALSILQMFFIAYNFNDWNSIFGDPTKFGLGLFSVLFDILFIIQHYCLYKNSSETRLSDSRDSLVDDKA